MRTSDYQSLPTKQNWKSDSSVLLATRDPVLVRIDELVDAVHSTSDIGEKANAYFQLYFALDYWLGHFKSDPLMNKNREPAIKVLYKFVAFQLCEYFGCTINTLPNVLEQYFGREMTAHGERIDSAGRAMALTRARIEKYKLHYNSKTKQFCYWEQQGEKLKLVPAESSEVRNRDSTKDGLKANYANFVLTMGGEMYMAPHVQFTTGQSWFHSSYRGGNPVLCAGSICIDSGKVTGIQNNSGHYQPTDLHIVNVLRHLHMLGHPINDIDVWNFTGKVRFDAPDFLAANGNWEAIIKRELLNQASHRSKVEAGALKRGLLERFQHGTPLKTLVDERHRAQPGRKYHEVWDEVVLEIMSVNRDYKRHLGALVGKPPAFGKPAPILQKPLVPGTKPWKKK